MSIFKKNDEIKFLCSLPIGQKLCSVITLYQPPKLTDLRCITVDEIESAQLRLINLTHAVRTNFSGRVDCQLSGDFAFSSSQGIMHVMESDVTEITRTPIMPPAPLLIPALGFVLGILTENQIRNLVPAIILSVIAIAGYILIQNKTAATKLCILTLAFSAGMIHYYTNNTALPPNNIKYFVQNANLSTTLRVRLTGTIISPPTIRSNEVTFPYYSNPKTRTQFILDAWEIQTLKRTAKISGLVLINIAGVHDIYKAGQKIEITGKIRAASTHPDNPLLPGEVNRWFLHNKIFAKMFIINPNDIKIKSHNNYSARTLFSKIRRFAHSAMLTTDIPYGKHTNELLDAVILGKRHRIDNQLNEAFIKIGAAHFLAVSGFHLAVLAMGVWLISSAAGIPRRYISLLIIGISIFYLIITGCRPSTLRATIMITIISLGIIFNRSTNTMNSLSAAALLMLFYNPNQVFNVGFQLTFISITGIILLTKPIFSALFGKTILTPPDHKTINTIKVLYKMTSDNIKTIICVSLAAAISAAPIVIYHFHIISLIGPLSAVILVIPASLLILLGFGQLLFSVLVPHTSVFISPLTNLAAQSVSSIALFLSKLPGVCLSVPAPAWWIIVSYYIILFYRNNKANLLKFRILAMLILTIAYLTTWISQSNDFSKNWVFADGKTTAIRSGNDLAIIDCSNSFIGQATGEINDISRNFLLTPRLAIISSPDQVFFNDLWALKNRFGNLRIFAPQSFAQQERKYEPLNILLNDKKLGIQLLPTGSKIHLKNIDLSLLYSPRTLFSDGAAVLVTLRGQKTLVTSILSSQACKLIPKNYPNLQANLLIFHSLTVGNKALKSFALKLKTKRIIITGWLKWKKLQSLRKLLERAGIETEKSPTVVKF